MSVRGVAIICGLTIREIARRRVLWVLLVLSLLSVGLVAWAVTQLVEHARDVGMGEARIRLGVSQVLVIIAFMSSFVLAMTGAFLAAPAIATDVESGAILAILARPIGRADLLLGRWSGVALVTTGYAVASGALAIGAVTLVSGYAPPEPLVAVACLAAQALVTLTLALVLGTRLPAMAAGAISVVAFGTAWLAGFLGSVSALLEAQALVPTLDVLRLLMPSDLLWRGVVHGLEPPLLQLVARGLDPRALAVDPFFSLEPMAPQSALWATTWIVLVLGAGVLAFRHREL